MVTNWSLFQDNPAGYHWWKHYDCFGRLALEKILSIRRPMISWFCCWQITWLGNQIQLLHVFSVSIFIFYVVDHNALKRNCIYGASWLVQGTLKVPLPVWLKFLRQHTLKYTNDIELSSDSTVTSVQSHIGTSLYSFNKPIRWLCSLRKISHYRFQDLLLQPCCMQLQMILD